MTLQELYDQSMKRWESFKIQGLLPALQFCNEGAINDVLNTNGCRYYQLTPCLIDVLKPKQIVELGGAMGVWSLCALHTLPEENHLYSITLAEGGLEFSFIKEKYSNFTPIVGDDLEIKNWKGVDLEKTDLWFFDALHTTEQLTKELELYSPFFKKGAVILFDDIHMDEIWPVWETIVEGKYGAMETLDITDPCHYSGYGIAKVL